MIVRDAGGGGHPHTPKPVHSPTAFMLRKLSVWACTCVCAYTHTQQEKRSILTICAWNTVPLQLYSHCPYSPFEYKPIWRHKLQASLALRSQGHTQTHTRTHTPHGFPVCVSGSDSMPETPSLFKVREWLLVRMSRELGPEWGGLSVIAQEDWPGQPLHLLGSSYS